MMPTSGSPVFVIQKGLSTVPSGKWESVIKVGWEDFQGYTAFLKSEKFAKCHCGRPSPPLSSGPLLPPYQGGLGGIPSSDRSLGL
jgi:hypothetical protein